MNTATTVGLGVGVSPREVIEQAAAMLHLHGLRLVQVEAPRDTLREMWRDPKVQCIPSADSDPDVRVMTCSGRVRVT